MNVNLQAEGDTYKHTPTPEYFEAILNSNNPQASSHQSATPPQPLHPKIVSALSQTSGLYGILWPTIIEQASYELRRDVLRHVSPYFGELCYPYRRSDRAKASYVSQDGNLEAKQYLPFVLDLPTDGAEWRCWGAKHCGFANEGAFRAFCALGDIDPGSGVVCNGDYSDRHWIWMSKNKDVTFETSYHPVSRQGYFGLTGVADKAIAMHQFMFDRAGEDTDWSEIVWARYYM